jgi:hypothetical protein
MVLIAGSDTLMQISSQKSANCNQGAIVLQRNTRYIWHRKIGTRKDRGAG